GFRAPFWPVRRSSSTVALWGQVRPGGATTVRLERRVGRTWRKVGSARTDARGAFQRTVRARGAATFRFAWSGGHSQARGVRAR
ncbi:MAG TPA: hypothetical protein VLB47_02345, partial [Solirubrobacteraceae bacterium]|nr:hypothetical protein [Solirubrobacteraceae bacterium]